MERINYHMKNKNLLIEPWLDYELLDSGANRKLERYGNHILIRPETQAIWEPRKPELWKRAQAEFRFVGAKGIWEKMDAKMPEMWQLAWKDARFSARLGSFKHLGIFPEQAANWEWIERCVKNVREPKVLNLFGYTGVASIVAEKVGAEVTHLDASKQSNAWAKENAELSEIPAGGIRYILDDALAFVLREGRRGAEYDGVILDPPAFGRGPKNEVWRIEEHLPRLLAGIEKIFSKKPGAFFLLNGYAAGYSATSFSQAVIDAFPNVKIEFGELQIAESDSGCVVPSGIYVRFVR
jgi:23S rRNA (cytosine1962-C5)-methyltransferase